MKSDFRDLDVWKKGKEIRISVSKIVKTFPVEEKYRLSDQMVRASRSITANIAEGYGRYNYQDIIRFCRQSRGSIYELIDHFEVAFESGYLDRDQYSRLNDDLDSILALLNGYIKFLSEKKKSLKSKPLNN
jgi:four helix bundle protein